MSWTNQIFKATKTRRLVSAWTVIGAKDVLLTRLREFDDLFDQVVFMCGAPGADGSLPDKWPAAERRRLVGELREMDISVINDYGGAWTGGCAEICRSPKIMSACIDKMVADCEETEADGVDIDFEGWPAESRFAYTDFLAQLGEKLHARGKMLSICAFSQTAAARRENGVGFIDPAAVAPHIDHYRSMTYDLFCPPSQYIGPTSTAPWGRDLMRDALALLPRHKLVMGLPTYSVDWNINDPSKSRQVNDAAFIAAREQESPIGRGWCYYWDVGLIRYTDAAEHAHLLYVTDARSTRSHLVTVDSLDLAGVCFWLLSGDEDLGIWRAVREHFGRS